MPTAYPSRARRAGAALEYAPGPCAPSSTSTAASPTPPAPSSRSTTTAFSTARASTRCSAPTTGEPFLFDRHMTRLRASAARIRLDVPFSDAEILERRARRRWRAAGLGRRARRGLRPHPADARRRRDHLRPGRVPGAVAGDHRQAACPTRPRRTYEKGATRGAGRARRPQPPGVGVAADQEQQPDQQRARHAAGHHAPAPRRRMFRNYRGELAECAQSNLFIVKDGVVKTPPLDAGLLAGITRAFVLEIGRASASRCEEVTAERPRPVRGRRGVLHQHDQGDRPDRRRWAIDEGGPAIASSDPVFRGPTTARLTGGATGAAALGRARRTLPSAGRRTSGCGRRTDCRCAPRSARTCRRAPTAAGYAACSRE